MNNFQYTSELEAFINALAVNEKWQSFNSEQKNAMIERAIFDVSAYAAKITVDFDLKNDFCRRAVFEQTAHITAQYDTNHNGKTILQESIAGFGSRTYKDPDSEWLSPRAVAYLGKAKIKVRILN